MTRKSTTDRAILDRNPETIKKALIQGNLSDTTLVLRNLKIKYDSPENKTTLYGAIKFIKDTALLFSLRAPLGIELSRALLINNQVQVLDRKNKKYLKGNYSYLKNQIHLDLNFNLVYNLLLGNFPNGYQSLPKYSRIAPELHSDTTVENRNFIGTFCAPGKDPYKMQCWMDRRLNRPAKMIFYKKRNIPEFSIEFRDYIKEAAYYVPQKLIIQRLSSTQSYRITLDYKNIEITSNTSLNFPIPSTYKKVDLE